MRSDASAETGFLVGLYRKFIAVALLNGLGIGSIAGVIYLHRLRLGTGAVSALQKEAHGHIQLFGFVFMLILGVGYHALPRFLGASFERKRTALVSFWSLTLASVGWLISLFAVDPESAHMARLFSSLALLVGTASFLHVILGLARGRFRSAGPYLGFIILGTLGFFLAGLADVGTSILHDTAASQNCGPLNEAVYGFGLYGGVLPWVYGMTLRSALMFVGAKDPRHGWLWASLGFTAFGAFLMGAGQAFSSVYAEAVGVTGVALGGMAFLVGSRVLEGSKFKMEPGAFPFATQLRVAYGFLVLFAALSLLWIHSSLTQGYADRALIQDGMRHAFVTGYLFLMITGMMGRVIPIFAGKTLRLPRVLTLGSVLLVVGALLRQSEVLAVLIGSPALVRASAFSGDLSIAGLFLSIVPVVVTLTTPAPRGDGRQVAIERRSETHGTKNFNKPVSA